MKAQSIEKIIEMLNSLGIKTIYKNDIPTQLGRIIEFEIEGTKYFIEWWTNQSYLKFKNEFSAPNIPFKHIGLNPYSPTTKHHDNLCFYDVKEPNTGQYPYNEIPFGALRIPFNVNRIKQL